MRASMEAAGRGDVITLYVGAGLLGLAIHLAWGAVWGVAFFVLARGARLRGPAALALAGILFGFVVMFFMSWVTLPITATVVGGGMPVEDMPSVVGWATFSIEHALFGLVLGIWAAARRAASEAPASEERHEPRLAA